MSAEEDSVEFRELRGKSGKVSLMVESGELFLWGRFLWGTHSPLLFELTSPDRPCDERENSPKPGIIGFLIYTMEDATFVRDHHKCCPEVWSASVVHQLENRIPKERLWLLFRHFVSFLARMNLIILYY